MTKSLMTKIDKNQNWETSNKYKKAYRWWKSDRHLHGPNWSFSDSCYYEIMKESFEKYGDCEDDCLQD